MISRKPFRKFSNYLWGAVSEAVAPMLRGLANTCSRGQTTPRHLWRRGLILGHTRIGDLLYRTCSLEYLKHGLADCDWHYLAAEDSGEVLRGNPFLESVLPLCATTASLRLADGAMEKLRKLDFDVALCTNAESYWLDLSLALRLRIPNRVAFVHRGLSGLVTHPVSCRYPSAWPAYFRDLVASVTGTPPDWPLVPRIYASQEDERAAEILWNKLQLRPASPVLVCFMTTREKSLIWPRDCYHKALALVQSNRPTQIVLAGSRGDQTDLTDFARQCEFGCHVAAGELNLRALCSFLRRCDGVLAPDSGSRHIANAAGTPVVFIRNLFCSKVETGKYCENEIDISPDVEFIAPEEQEQYLRQVTPENAAHAILKALAKPRQLAKVNRSI